MYDQKLVEAQCKLTTANLELQRLRASADQHTQEMSYVRRLLEREQRERSSLESEVHALRNSLKSGSSARIEPPSDSERVLLLKAQLEDAQNRTPTLALPVPVPVPVPVPSPSPSPLLAPAPCPCPYLGPHPWP